MAERDRDIERERWNRERERERERKREKYSDRSKQIPLRQTVCVFCLSFTGT